VTRLILVHGSVTNADLSWRRQQTLAGTSTCSHRTGPLPAGPPVERVDFDRDADWLRELVRPAITWWATPTARGALVAAPTLDLGSLTVIEPPAFGVARGDTDVEAWLDGSSTLPRHSVRAYTEAFLVHVAPPSACRIR